MNSYRYYPDLNDLLIHLANYGQAPHDAVPVILQIIEKAPVLTKLYAARALWVIDPSQGQHIYSLLMATLQPHQTSLLVVDCLGDMGAIAEPALEKLREIATSEKRFIDHNTDIAFDVEIQQLAKEAIAKIETALNAKE